MTTNPETQRIIGGLQAEVKSIAKSVDELKDTIETLGEQLLGLRDDLNQRRGATKMLVWICAAVGSVGGFVGAAFKTYLGNV